MKRKPEAVALEARANSIVRQQALIRSNTR